MHLHSDITTPPTQAQQPRCRAGGSVPKVQRSGAWPLVAAIALVVFATPSLALDLPLLGKPKRGSNPQQPTDSFAPQGRQADDARDSREARDAAREAQSINGGGRVLSVDEANGGWRVKLLKEGNVRFVFVPN